MDTTLPYVRASFLIFVLIIIIIIVIIFIFHSFHMNEGDQGRKLLMSVFFLLMAVSCRYNLIWGDLNFVNNEFVDPACISVCSS